MRDAFSWSFPLGRLFGITIRVHWLFPVVALGLILRVASQKDGVQGEWTDAVWISVLVFFSVLLHEFGHCFAARSVEGDAQEILMWPLGGLAFVEVPHTPRANFITVAAGPAMNLLLCVVSFVLFGWMTHFELQPAWNPIYAPFRSYADGTVIMHNWAGAAVPLSEFFPVLLYRLFWVNWVQFLLNLLVLGYPLDGGRLLQSVVWWWTGSYHRATTIAVWSGFGFAILGFLICLWVNEVMVMCLAIFIYMSCRQQWVILETGGEEQLFGYDFSQGYTSLERDQAAAAPPRRKQPGMIQRWLQRRAARKLQREQEVREAEERRMDELLEKVQRDGLQSLTDEERRFLTRVSARYRNRH